MSKSITTGVIGQSVGTITFEDGKAEAEMVYGDGSTGPFLHLTMTNADEVPESAQVAMERHEVHEFANFLLEMIQEKP